MRHRKAGRHLTRTSAHREALRRNLAQSLFEHGQIETTLPKAREVRRFVERLITLARRGTMPDRQRVIALLGDRAIIPADGREAYDGMGRAARAKVLRARSGRRHRTGAVPAAYNKKKFTFVASSVVHKLMTEVAPRFKDRPGGYTRLIRLARQRLGDNSDLALLQLVPEDESPPDNVRKVVGRRKRRTEVRKRALRGQRPSRREAAASGSASAAAPAERATAGPDETEQS
jgi:large subunit ribosomal protein L17